MKYFRVIGLLVAALLIGNLADAAWEADVDSKTQV